MTDFAPYKALKLTAWDTLTFDERGVLHRVEGLMLENGKAVLQDTFECPPVRVVRIPS